MDFIAPAEKLTLLKESLARLGSVAIGFSGGVDSSFLIKAAYDTLMDGAVAVTYASPLMPGMELNKALRTAKNVGIKHIVIDGVIGEEIISNPPERCYLCKRRMFQSIASESMKLGIPYVADGSNFDDNSKDRPGMAALMELSVLSPLAGAGLTKNEIMELALGSSFADLDMSSYSCLATRVPFGESLTITKLERIEKAEFFLSRIGFARVWVRDINGDALVEAGPGEQSKLTKVPDDIRRELKSLGYKSVYIKT